MSESSKILYFPFSQTQKYTYLKNGKDTLEFRCVLTTDKVFGSTSSGCNSYDWEVLIANLINPNLVDTIKWKLNDYSTFSQLSPVQINVSLKSTDLNQPYYLIDTCTTDYRGTYLDNLIVFMGNSNTLWFKKKYGIVKFKDANGDIYEIIF